ncbi:MAG: hypothetical protein HC785_18900 [Calothrix sp. CSU_2_0]|nr:hypothetical protein [Calothrix sp. CSU_2_0]
MKLFLYKPLMPRAYRISPKTQTAISSRLMPRAYRTLQSKPKPRSHSPQTKRDRTPIKSQKAIATPKNPHHQTRSQSH